MIIYIEEEIKKIAQSLLSQLPADCKNNYQTLTVGIDTKGNFGWQSGDNSYSGGAYGFPIWGVCHFDSKSALEDIVGEILNQLSDY
jgi:hypothetical protein